ncbi:MAG: T9SS type A sorting domain-containing protein [Bacteroidota bacterium]
MKKLICIFLLLGMSGSLIAQLEIERSVIAPGGIYGSNGTLEISSTMGQIEVRTLLSLNGTIVLTQGFQQPENLSTGTGELIDIVVDYNIFPNPTTRWLTVELNAAKPAEIELGLYDIRGRSIGVPNQKHTISGPFETRFDLNNVTDGFYFLGLKDKDGRLMATWKIQRIH